MDKLFLSEAAIAVNGHAVGECEIDNISTDSRCIEGNCMYTAIIGENFDGHTFCKSAEQNGAKAFLVSAVPANTDLPYIIVDDTEKAFLELSKYYLSKLSIKKAAVTGSVGKTTTKEMLYAVLNEKYKTLKTEGNLNNQIGLPRTIFRLDNSYEAGVFELGMSNFGEISALSNAVQPDLGIVTLIGVSHMENLGSREGIMRAKLEILDGMKKGSPLIVSGDDDYLCDYKNPDYKIIKTGINNKEADYIAENIIEDEYSTSFVVSFNSNSQKIVIPTLGEHNVRNALSAFAAGIEFGVSPMDIARGLANYKPSGMRQNIVKKGTVTVIEDCYNASPDSMKASLETLKKIQNPGRKIAVLADMLELGHISENAHYDVGRIAAENKSDILICYGKESEKTAEGALNSGMSEVYHFDNKTDLNKKLAQEVKDGDAVLFKGSRGMALEESISFLYEILDK